MTFRVLSRRMRSCRVATGMSVRILPQLSSAQPSQACIVKPSSSGAMGKREQRRWRQREPTPEKRRTRGKASSDDRRRGHTEPAEESATRGRAESLPPTGYL